MCFLFTACSKCLAIAFIFRRLLGTIDSHQLFSCLFFQAGWERNVLLTADIFILYIFTAHFDRSLLSRWRVINIHFIFNFFFNCILFIVKNKDILCLFFFRNNYRLCSRIYPFRRTFVPCIGIGVYWLGFSCIWILRVGLLILHLRKLRKRRSKWPTTVLNSKFNR